MTDEGRRSDSTRFTDEAPDASPADSAEHDAPEVGDVAFTDNAPASDGPLPSDDPDVSASASGVLLADVAPGAESDLARIHSRETEQNAVSQARAEREREARKAKRMERYEPQITVERAETVVSAKDEKGVAVCPACQAKCEFTAALCVRCGAEIPSAIPGSDRPRGGRRYGNYQTFNERQQGAQPEGHAWDMLPEEKRREFEAAELRKEERRRHSVFKVRLYLKRVMAMLAALSAGLGLVTTAFSLGAGFPGVLAFLMDAGLGAGAGYLLWRKKGGRVYGLIFFGGAGMASIAGKLALGGIAAMLGGSIVGAFSLPIFVGVLGGQMVLGYLLGMAVEWEFLDSHT